MDEAVGSGSSLLGYGWVGSIDELESAGPEL